MPDRDPLPPGPRRFPFVGSLPAFARDPLRFLNDAARDHGDVFYMGKAMGRHMYVFIRPEHVKHILQENNRNYLKGDNFKAIKLVVGEGLVVSEGAHWHKQRRIVQPVFHRQRIAALAERMADVVTGALRTWEGRSPSARLPVSFEMMRITQRVLMRTLFDFDSDAQTNELCRAWDVVLEFLTDRLFAPPIQLPLAVPTPSNRRFVRAMKVLDDAVYGILRESRAKGRDTGDLLSLLLAATDEDTGARMTDRDLRDEIMTMFAGGFETSAMVLSWVWHLLAAHPDVESRLHREVDEILGGRVVTAADLPKLRYVRMVIEETMRLFPGAWIFTRTNVGPDELAGYRLPAGSIIFICPYLTQRHPEFWESPATFDPERFTPERAAARPRYAYFPFGGGPRLCVGEAFAMMEMQIVVALTAQRFRLRPATGNTVVPRGMFTLRPQPEIEMTLEPRGPTAVLRADGAGAA